MLAYNSILFRTMIERAQKAGANNVSTNARTLSLVGSMNDRILNPALIAEFNKLINYIELCTNEDGHYSERRIEKGEILYMPSCTVNGYIVYDFGGYDIISITMVCYD
jgi:hypothetical protein